MDIMVSLYNKILLKYDIMEKFNIEIDEDDSFKSITVTPVHKLNKNNKYESFIINKSKDSEKPYKITKVQYSFKHRMNIDDYPDFYTEKGVIDLLRDLGKPRVVKNIYELSKFKKAIENDERYKEFTSFTDKEYSIKTIYPNAGIAFILMTYYSADQVPLRCHMKLYISSSSSKNYRLYYTNDFMHDAVLYEGNRMDNCLNAFFKMLLLNEREVETKWK